MENKEIYKDEKKLSDTALQTSLVLLFGEFLLASVERADTFSPMLPFLWHEPDFGKCST